jgi:hypothetical protein
MMADYVNLILGAAPMKKSWTNLIKWTPFILLFAVLISLSPTTVMGVGESSTNFGIYVPPNGGSPSRDPALVVTAVQDGTSVDIIDGNEDGDNDDTATGLTLDAGQSYLIYIQEGAVNDDYGGKEDGDYFQITSSKPVIVANMTVNTNWQHDFVPADNRRMSGTSFYLFIPHNYGSSTANMLVNLFAYNDATDVEVIDITDTATTSSGLSTVVSDANGSSIFSYTLDKGEDLLEVHNQTISLEQGHTYHLLSNKDVTVQFGSLGKAMSGSRDGGAYVPGKNGYSADKTFYFVIPYRVASEREMRLVTYEQPANIVIRGWNVQHGRWDELQTLALPKYGHGELVGSELGSNYYFFEVTSDETISVFEANWLETGSFGTSDIMTFISSSAGIGAGDNFLAYMGPPALNPQGQKLSYLYVYSYQATTGYAYDPDSYGEYIELFNNSGATIDLEDWRLTNAEGWSVTLPAGLQVSPGATFLLEFHEKATNAGADYVFGDTYSKFKIDNGADTISLVNPAGEEVDAVSFTDTGWGSHGVYYALERVNPNAAFLAGNARDSSTAVAAGSSNLGSYYGTPRRSSRQRRQWAGQPGD